MSAATIERKWRMTNIEGDYFFLSNDRRTLCRVGPYEEDGSAEDGRGGYVTGRHWIAFVFNGTPAEAEALAQADPEEFVYRWGIINGYFPRWREVAFMLRTRREAIQAALEASEKP